MKSPPFGGRSPQVNNRDKTRRKNANLFLGFILGIAENRTKHKVKWTLRLSEEIVEFRLSVLRKRIDWSVGTAEIQDRCHQNLEMR
jgi:hypothetical protein